MGEKGRREKGERRRAFHPPTHPSIHFDAQLPSSYHKAPRRQHRRRRVSQSRPDRGALSPNSSPNEPTDQNRTEQNRTHAQTRGTRTITIYHYYCSCSEGTKRNIWNNQRCKQV